MNTWKVILATLVIFVAGVVAGGLVATYTPRAQQRHRRPAAPGQPETASRGQTNVNVPFREPSRPNLPNPNPQLLRKEFLQKLDREVQLTTEQHERIEKIMGEGQERARQLYDRITPDLRRELAETRGRILDVLTPEQRVKFEALVKQRPRELRRSAPPRDGASPGGAQPAPAEPPRNL